MPISQSTLRTHASRTTASRQPLDETRRQGGQTAFLCHSHLDNGLALGVQHFLNSHGWDVYIDWQDTTMPEKPNRETAEKIQSKIQAANWFLFLATANSRASRWCPWELGYADGKKKLDSIWIIPTKDDAGNTHGNEYLELYGRIDEATGNKLGAFEPRQTSGRLVESMGRP